MTMFNLLVVLVLFPLIQTLMAKVVIDLDVNINYFAFYVVNAIIGLFILVMVT